ncbi:MAG: flagellar basal body-associated FliL family protein [Spirochaetales bacterium]|nr:flagellar basal body-associated FliL family protein [Spirochaetales bacterium]
MSDEERFLDDDDQQPTADELETGKKESILPSILIKILQWTAIIIGVIIVIVFVSWLTFTILMRDKVSQAPAVTSKEYVNKKLMYDYYKNIEPIRGQTADVPPKTFLARIVIGYTKGVTVIQNELIERTDKIQNLLLKYLSNKTGDEMAPQNFERMEDELTQKINDIMVEQISEVLFTEIQAF